MPENRVYGERGTQSATQHTTPTIMPAKKTTKKVAAKKPAAKKVSAKKAPKKKASSTTKKEVKKAAPKKAEKPAKKSVAKKATAKKTAKKTTTKKSVPSLEAIAKAAYLNYRRRMELGLPGDNDSDWLEAERSVNKG